MGAAARFSLVTRPVSYKVFLSVKDRNEMSFNVNILTIIVTANP